METLTRTEQRTNARAELSWPVSMWLPEASRFFNGRSTNISKSGVFIDAPMTMPVRPGHVVEVNFPRSQSLAERKGHFARIKSGRVVRVDRNNVLKNASIGVAIRFDD